MFSLHRWPPTVPFFDHINAVVSHKFIFSPDLFPVIQAHIFNTNLTSLLGCPISIAIQHRQSKTIDPLSQKINFFSMPGTWVSTWVFSCHHMLYQQVLTDLSPKYTPHLLFAICPAIVWSKPPPSLFWNTVTDFPLVSQLQFELL